MSETPRTDAKCSDVDTYDGKYVVELRPPETITDFEKSRGGRWVEADFARELERECERYREILESWERDGDALVRLLGNDVGAHDIAELLAETRQALAKKP